MFRTAALDLSNHERLVLDVAPPSGADATTMLYLHGLGSHRGGEKATFFARELTARGFGFLRFDFRGHGESSGRLEELTLTRQLDDLRAVVQFLASGAAGPPPRRLILIGASLGALTAAWCSALQLAPVAAQILIAPAFRIIERYLAALGEFGRARWKRDGIYRFVGPWFQFDLRWDVIEDGERYPHALLIEKTRAPTLILHGTRDESAPFKVSEEFVAQCATLHADASPRLVPIEGGDHRLTAYKERLLEAIVNFVDGLAPRRDREGGSTCGAR